VKEPFSPALWTNRLLVVAVVLLGLIGVVSAASLAIQSRTKSDLEKRVENLEQWQGRAQAVFSAMAKKVGKELGEP
jgi:uncharacterized protein YukE